MTNRGMSCFQADFARALFEQSNTVSAPWLEQPAFAVYRNTVMKGCIDALEANYPSVARLVGRDWFRSAAAVFIAANPPHGSSLFSYGESFPHFLRDFEPAARLDYLGGVASLDRFWTESHIAADATPLRAAQLATLPPAALTACRPKPHPAARWAWYDVQPVYSIWERNRVQVDSPAELAWQGEGALLTRPDSTVLWQPASQADCAFLDACAAGHTLAAAVEQAQLADPAADLMAVVSRLLSAGAIENLPNPTSGEPS